jgi:formylglycine-generating enzyme required for sulfatase activity
VTSINYFDAGRYCNWLSQRAGISKSHWCYDDSSGGIRCNLFPDFRYRTGYRLPTEQEWESACRAGTNGSWFFGDSKELVKHYGWNRDNSKERLAPVAQLKPNDFGLFDTLGNANEWCIHGEGAGALGQQVLRGGSADFDARYLTATQRLEFKPAHVNEFVGFRIARSIYVEP